MPSWLSASALLLVGCAQSSVAPDAAVLDGARRDGALHDAFADTLDAADGCMPPPPPYSSLVGSTFPPLDGLFDCAGSPWSFYDVCGTPTLVAIVAGWDARSIQVSLALTERYLDPFPSLRVVVVVAQTEDYAVADGRYCAMWRERYALEDAEVVTDPEQRSSVLALPDDYGVGTVFLVDPRGEIVYRARWTAEAATILDEAVSELLRP